MADLAKAARAWIGRDGTVSIELPGRWFGRPFDNMHRLTWASSGPHRTILEFDGQLALLLVEPAGIVVDGDVAAITATRIVLDWREYGSGGTYRTEVFDGGTVRLHRH